MDVFHLILLAALVVAGGWAWTQRRRTRETERVLADLAEGRAPGAEAWSLAPELATAVERLSRRNDRLTRRAAEEASSLRAILSSMVEAVMVTDGERVIRMVNESFREMFGVKGDPSGGTVLSVLREAAAEEVVRDTLETAVPQSREIAVSSSGQTRHFAVNAVPLVDRGGSANGAVLVFHDITQLRQLETMRREFVSNVSHELRTPLSIFHGYVENLIDDPQMPEPERVEVLEIMRRHSLRLNALLEDLLLLARLESKRLELDPVSIDLETFLPEFFDEWRGRHGGRELEFRLEMAPDLPELKADVMRLEQVLQNLLENSAKYTAAGGRVVLSASAEEDHVLLAVSDTGVGIPPSDLPHIFERFYRVGKARNRDAGGTGLGLSIVKHIVALHGGRVDAESVYGKGTTITARFPR